MVKATAKQPSNRLFLLCADFDSVVRVADDPGRTGAVIQLTYCVHARCELLDRKLLRPRLEPGDARLHLWPP